MADPTVGIKVVEVKPAESWQTPPVIHVHGLTVGMIGYTCINGLGLLAKRLYEHGVVQRCLQMPHPQHADRSREWYSPDDLFQLPQSEAFLVGDRVGEHLLHQPKLDCLLLLENVWPRSTWEVVRRAKELGIRIAMNVNYEFTPFPLPVKPDAFLCPSILDLDYCSPGGQCHVPGVPATFLPIPVEVPWRLRERALTFIHNAGHGGVNGRNSTAEILDAIHLLKSDAKVIVRMQPGRVSMLELHNRYRHLSVHHSNLRLEFREVEEAELWDEGDVCLHPTKWDGVSLPIQEAFAAGFTVMTTRRRPMDTWLPKEPLLSVSKTERMRVNSTDFTASFVSPEAIADAIDGWYGRDVSSFSLQGKKWAEEHSWKKLFPKWIEALKGA